jgi:membrane protein YqaA with SNARE-associated domain
LKSILKRYSAFILKYLAPLGPWGVLAITALDAAAFGLPLDAIMVGYVYERPSWFLVFPVMGALGSALGSLIVYGIGLKGEEMVLEKRISKEKLERLRDRFERQEFLALMIPAMLPPPTPFKLFVLSAGVFRMKVRDFLLAIFSGRLVRFMVLAVITRYFGPQIVHTLAAVFRQHLVASLAVLVGLLALVGLLFIRRPAEKIAANASRQ